MRRFLAQRQTSDLSAPATRSRGRYFKAAVFAFACLAGLGFSEGEPSVARADDGGMMSFLLSGNSGGRARIAAPAYRMETRVVRQHASFARKVATARDKVLARSARLALAHKSAKRRPTVLATPAVAGVKLIRAVSLDIPSTGAQTAAARALAMKAAAAAARPQDGYLQDKTLRRGDIVATAAGLRLFLGAAHFPYRAHDFVSVTSSRRIAQRADLVALDRALRGIRLAPQQKQIVKVATRAKPVAIAVAARAAADVRRIGAKPAPQIVAMAYAPRADLQRFEAGARRLEPGEIRAVAAIERVVRRIDLAPAPGAARAEPPVSARRQSAGLKKSE